MNEASSSRPTLNSQLSEGEFLRWYWLKDELAEYARARGIRSTGSKDLLAARIAASLGGRAFVEPKAATRVTGRQLEGVLTAETVIPVGQRSSQLVRAWMTEQIGPAFHFDADMRSFFAESDGTQTMHDAVNHWGATRGRGARSIDSQFEYNRFTRSWYEKHPDSTREELLAAWRNYREQPLDQRDRA